MGMPAVLDCSQASAQRRGQHHRLYDGGGAGPDWHRCTWYGGGFWLYKKRVLQSAADNAAYSAAAAYAASKTSDITAQARAITANDYNLVHGVNNVTVAVNRPPSGGCYTGTSNYTGANAIEVIVTEPQPPRLSSIWLSNNVNLCGRGVALVPSTGDCVLAWHRQVRAFQLLAITSIFR